MRRSIGQGGCPSSLNARAQTSDWRRPQVTVSSAGSFARPGRGVSTERISKGSYDSKRGPGNPSSFSAMADHSFWSPPRVSPSNHQVPLHRCPKIAPPGVSTRQRSVGGNGREGLVGSWRPPILPRPLAVVRRSSSAQRHVHGLTLPTKALSAPPRGPYRRHLARPGRDVSTERSERSLVNRTTRCRTEAQALPWRVPWLREGDSEERAAPAIARAESARLMHDESSNRDATRAR